MKIIPFVEKKFINFSFFFDVRNLIITCLGITF